MAEETVGWGFAEAKRYIPGGVNSPVRSFKAVGGVPVFIKRGSGSRIYSEDGREFIDYCMSWGAMILGHTHPAVTDALSAAIKNGTSFGAATRLEIEFAGLLISAVPSMEQVRLTNSGTEAVMAAIRLARAYTKRNKVVRFSGSYHGTADYLLECRGIPDDFKRHTLACPYNDIENTREIINRHKKDIACVIVEPVEANTGVVLPGSGFLKCLRDATQKYNIVLIFDEVITGFRLGFGGAQKLFGVKPDLTCLGKIIGGGLPAGAFGGRREIMRLLAPVGNVYQAGTFSGNPATTSAGLAALNILLRENPYDKLEKLTKGLCENINRLAGRYKIGLKANFIGSMFGINCDNGLFKKFYHKLLNEGVYLSPSRYEANFTSTAHTEQDIDKTLKATELAFKNTL